MNLELDPAALGTIATAVAAVATLIGQILTRRTTRQIQASQEVKAASVTEIEHEVKPNNGNSLRDAVDRIEATVNGLVETVGENTRRIETIESRRRWGF